MNQIVHIIQTKNETLEDLRMLHKDLTNRADALKLISNKVQPSIFKVLPIHEYTMGLIFLIHAKALKATPDKYFKMLVESLIVQFNPEQARYASKEFGVILNTYTRIVREESPASRANAMTFLLMALMRLQVTENHLTPMHACYLSLALKNKNYAAGEALLKKKIFDIDPLKTGMTPRDMLLYYYYGGMIYCGLKQWDNALHSFEIAISVPAQAISAIAVESYKKYILVSCIAHGKRRPLPKAASSIIQRHMDAYCAQYVSFADALAKPATAVVDPAKSVSVLFKNNKKAFEKDKNLGLVHQCLDARKRRAIQQLTSTYLTIGLADIAKLVKLESADEVEELLLRMIESGEIRARISQRDKMVIFTDVDEASVTEAMDTLNKRLGESIELANRLRELDTNVALSNEFIQQTNSIPGEFLSSGSSTHSTAASASDSGLPRNFRHLVSMIPQ